MNPVSADVPFSVRVRLAGAAAAGAPYAAAAGAPCAGAVIEVTGDLDLFTAGQLEAALTTVARGTTTCIDLTECAYIDSAGLHVLRTHTRDIGPEHVTLVIPAGSPLRRVLEITGLDRFFRIAAERPQGRG